MAFAVSWQQINGFDSIILEDKVEGTQVIILPENGAMMYSFIIQTDNGPFNIIDNYADKQVMENELKNSFKSCKLSPYACRIPDGKYSIGEQHYKFEHLHYDGSSIHGLLYNKQFKLADHSSDDHQASVLLKYNYNQNDAGYPFEYRCEVRYTLMPSNVLQLQTTVINLDEVSIPIADGWHPYFTLGGKVDDWMLHFNASSVLEFNESLIPTGNLLPYEKFLDKQPLEGVTLDNSFVLNKGGAIACTLYNPANNLYVSFLPDDSYPYLQIYIPPGRRSIAIENLSGAPNCFNNKMGLILLEPGRSKTFTVYYKTNKE